MPNIKPTEEARSLGRQAAAREACATARPTKTLTKRLEAAVAGGDKNQVEAEHRALVRWLDRAAGRAHCTANTARAQKAQARAARLYAEALARDSGLAGPRDVDQRTLELEESTARREPTLDGVVEAPRGLDDRSRSSSGS